MKRVLIASFAGLLVVSGGVFAQISGSDHDLSGQEGIDEVCIFCHTPHNAIPAVPLWNHALSTATFTAYDSATMNALDNDDWIGTDGNISALCMSCHDGSVALGSIGGNTGSSFIDNAVKFDKDLSNHHPVAFTYDSTLQAVDGELSDPSTLGNGVTLFGSGVDQLECSSCHDAHNPTNAPFLVVSNAGSTLCFTCHLK